MVDLSTMAMDMARNKKEGEKERKLLHELIHMLEISIAIPLFFNEKFKMSFHCNQGRLFEEYAQQVKDDFNTSHVHYDFLFLP